jgi:hypothetical protein
VTALATRMDRLTPKYKSKWEPQYAEQLEMLRRAGEVLWYRYEGIRLRLADGALFSPDFAVVAKDGALEFHEVKGMWREAARVRWKLAKESFPFVFKLVTKGKGKTGRFTVTEEE